MLTRSINNKPKSVFSDTDVTEHLADLHNRYVIVPADKASNNVVFVCKTYYFECLQRELDLDDSTFKSTYQWTTFSKNEISENHRSVLSSFAKILTYLSCIGSQNYTRIPISSASLLDRLVALLSLLPNY